MVDLGDRRETECVGEVWPDRRCCNESMEVSGSCLCSRCDEDNKRRSGGRRVYMRCLLVAVRRGRVKVMLHDWTRIWPFCCVSSRLTWIASDPHVLLFEDEHGRVGTGLPARDLPSTTHAGPAIIYARPVEV